jgi:WD40 repeat protein
VIVLTHISDPVDRLSFAPVESLLAAGHTNGRFEVWNLSEQRVISGSFRRFSRAPFDFRFHHSAPQLYFARAFDEVHWFDPTTPEIDLLCRGTGWAQALVLTRDATRLLVCEQERFEFRLFDLTRGPDAPPVWTTPVYERHAVSVSVSIALLPTEERFVVVECHRNTQPRVAVRALETGDLLAASRIPDRIVSGFALAPDGASAAVVCGRSVFVYQTAKIKTAPRKVINANRKNFTGIAFHPSGRYLAATSIDATVKLYDTTTWKAARTFTWDVGEMRSVAFSPDGTLAAAGSDSGKVVAWDVDL